MKTKIFSELRFWRNKFARKSSYNLLKMKFIQRTTNSLMAPIVCQSIVLQFLLLSVLAIFLLFSSRKSLHCFTRIVFHVGQMRLRNSKLGSSEKAVRLVFTRIIRYYASLVWQILDNMSNSTSIPSYNTNYVISKEKSVNIYWQCIHFCVLINMCRLLVCINMKFCEHTHTPLCM